ncbi:MAG TPA: Clp protease N-terminal domain-containing protein [Acidimicrobiales bacterium]|nr:Clp protease N-terminal domain-containing protein [Acidimicrobiales bacterium]
MFERFTNRARRVVVLSQEEARRLGHGYIGTEHLLLGLLGVDDGVGARALVASGVDLDGARAQVESIVGRGEAPVSGHVPFTPRAKRVLELALREALQLGHNYIGTEHVLLGIVREGEGAASRVLAAMGAVPADVDARVRVLLTVPRSGAAGAAAPGAATAAPAPAGGVGLPLEGGEATLPVLRRLTPAAVRALAEAGVEAARLGDAGVGDVHVLLGILAEGGGRGARALEAVGLTLESTRAAAERYPGRVEGAGPPVLLGPALDVIELALVEAVAAGSDTIDTDHLLLGFVRRAEDGTGLAGQALPALGTTAEAIRAAVAGLDEG